MTPDTVLEILAEAKKLAQRYRALTGKPLGITGEVAEYEAARILGVTLLPARQTGYDATETRDGGVRRLQIKGLNAAPSVPFMYACVYIKRVSRPVSGRPGLTARTRRLPS
ncbi:hypothetical protein [Piscinibacter sp.]|jgi:hypothetical protein|uniref:hypothetical protein n=1 Tax=Piscinibacter sp. TaxID=1903157 RepID=UPI00355A8462